MNVCQLVETAAQNDPSGLAILNAHTKKEISYQELHVQMLRTASGLAEIGVAAGDRVAIVLDNSEDFLFFFLGILRIKAIAVLVKPAYRDVELTEIFANSNPEFVIIEDKYLSHCDKFLEGRTVVVRGNKIESGVSGARETLNWRRIHESKILPRLPDNIDESDLASINYTYRGLGYPLGAMLTHGTYVHGGIGIVECVDPGAGDKSLLILPLTHIFTLVACVIAPIMRRSTIVILNSIRPRAIFSCIDDFGVSIVTAVPTIYKVLVDNAKPAYALETWTKALSGGSWLGREDALVLDRELGVTVINGYGLTEYAPVVANRFDIHRYDTIGPICYGVQVRIADENGNACRTGETGEILVKSPYLMKGYYRRPQETVSAFVGEWFRTGDMGYVDDDGFYHFARVGKNIAKVGANIVDIEELRRVLESISQADCNAAITVVPHELWGHTVEVSVRSRQCLDDRALRALLISRLASYKFPRSIQTILDGNV